MAHNIESLAWTGEKPWHSLGTQVAGNLSAHEMQVAAGLDWEVEKFDTYYKVNGVEYRDNQQVLLRTSDMTKLSNVGEDWNAVQNSAAFEFFHKFVEAGKMTMETAGSLQDGKIVWAMAKVGKDFTLFGNDKVEAYLLFTNPHQYGKSIDVRFQGVRVVCNNTLTMALNSKVNNVFKQSHRLEFKPEVVEQALHMVDKRMEDYKTAAEFLGSKRFTPETAQEFFDEVFPIAEYKGTGKRKSKEHSTNSTQSMLALQHQPGLEYAPGSFWQIANAVTFVTDHIMGRTDDARLSNAWYGPVKDLKLKAFNLAMDYAKKV